MRFADLLTVLAFAEFLDQLRAERRQIVGPAARHQRCIDHDSLSTTLAPAFFKSVRIVGQLVGVRPFAGPALINTQGAWQIAPIGRPSSANERTNASACGLMRN